ncbi:MAG: TolC family protein, partial [Prevotella sp.]|nr:TolC family protein [Prevotella sp.]
MKLLFLFLLLAVPAARLNAQSLDECQRLAREHYPVVRQYDLIARTEQYDLSNAARAWIPQIALSAQATWQTDVAKYPDALSSMLAQQGVTISGMRKDQYKVAVDISQNIWDGGQSKASRAIAEAEATERRNRTDVDLYDLQARVENIYFSILLLDERVAQTKALISLLESNLSRMQVYNKNGIATQADVDAVEAELLTARQALG